MRVTGERWGVVLVLAVFSACLCCLPTVKTLTSDGRQAQRAEVLSVDDSGVALHGLIEFGTQRLRVRLADGREFSAENELRAQMDLDKKFAVGDTALVIVPEGVAADDVLVARDHWRLGWGSVLFAGFAVLLVAFGGLTGLKALFSFAFSCLAVWKILIPLTLRGGSASGIAFMTVAVLTVVIMVLVAGWTKKCLAATLGSLLGVVSSLALAHVFGRLMHVNGATMPFAQTLLYSGYSFLDLQDVFFGAIVLASSGAVMDLAMDIAAGVAEVKFHNPSLGFRPLLGSGLRMGRAVVGTMTTTLLLAYSGGYLTLLMAFAAQGTHPLDFLNSTLVSAELVKTLVGSFGLVLVAPFTAAVSAVIFRYSVSQHRASGVD